MSGGQYDPRIHHRRSIRMKGHDYAGGGMYFVTMCAHREFIRFARGNPFGRPGGARQASPEQKLIWERMRITAEKCPFMAWEEAVVMPDHMHALIRMEGGQQRLGDVIGGFKAAVSREIRRGNTCVALSSCVALPRRVRIWHRNYYDVIVRHTDAEARIRRYIRMNPWRLVSAGTWEDASGAHRPSRPYRAIGNPALLNMPTIGLLCSRDCPPSVLEAACERAARGKRAHCIISGFHSEPERHILDALLGSDARVICCPAWGIDQMHIPDTWLPALEKNRMMILEIGSHNSDLASASERNAFVMEAAETLWFPHIRPGGLLSRQLATLGVADKILSKATACSATPTVGVG